MTEEIPFVGVFLEVPVHGRNQHRTDAGARLSNKKRNPEKDTAEGRFQTSILGMDMVWTLSCEDRGLAIVGNVRSEEELHYG